MARLRNWLGLGVMVSVLCLITTVLVAAQDGFKPSYLPTLHVTPLEGKIKIDGNLDDSGWKSAQKCGGFAETSPGDQVKPDVESAAWITYDEFNLYVALIAWDNPKEIRVSMRDRDNIFKDDYFGVLLDTYGDFSWGYELFVNPLGIQGDLRLMQNGNEDQSFDIVWDSRGKVTDSGYQVEIAIPFSSLRFADKPEQTWHIQFWRDRQRDVRYRYAWAARDRDNPCFQCQWGTLTGIKGIKPGSSFDLLPNLVAYQGGEREEASGGLPGEFHSGDPKAEVSMFARYGLTPNATIEGTINPDFSQVESDEAQVDVNTTFALFFSEQRPFFQEGSDLYDSYIDAIYTRSINDPSAATKLCGKFGRTSVAYIFARDDHTPMLLPFEERSRFIGLGKSTSNIARFRYTLQGSSFLGGLVTDRRIDGGGAGSVFGADGKLWFWKNYNLAFQVLGSRTSEINDTSLSSDFNSETFDREKYTAALDGESYMGHAAFVGLNRSGRHWDGYLEYWAFSPSFRTDNGFTTHNDYRNICTWNGVSFMPDRPWLTEYQVAMEYGRSWNFNEPFKNVNDEWVRGALYFLTKNQTAVQFTYLNSRELFRGIFFEGISIADLNMDTRLSGKVSCGGGYSIGKSIWRTFSDTPVLGNKRDIELYLNVRPTQRLYVESILEFSRMDYPDSYLADHPGVDKEIFDGYIVVTRINYQFTRQLFLRLFAQYDDFGDVVDIEPLLTYKVNPFTIFYVGARSNYDYLRSEDYSGLNDSQWKLSSRQIFAKFQYLFQI